MCQAWPRSLGYSREEHRYGADVMECCKNREKLSVSGAEWVGGKSIVGHRKIGRNQIMQVENIEEYKMKETWSDLKF